MESVVRFAVRDQRGRRAGTWRCFTNGGTDSSFYVMCRTIGSDFKLSFHESGDCNYSITRATYEERMEADARPASRYLEHWRRPAPLGGGDLIHVCSVIVPGNSPSVPDVEERNIVWVEDPGSGRGIEFAVFVSRRSDPVEWLASQGTTAGLTGRFNLPNGDAVSVAHMTRVLTFSGHQIQGTPRFFTGGQEALAKGEQLRAILYAVDSKDARILLDVPIEDPDADAR